ASLDLVSTDARLELHNLEWPILTRDEERPPVWLGPGARVEDSLGADGWRIEGHVRRSILFAGVHVGPGAVVSESVIMADTWVGDGARVDHSILDKYVRIGAGARVGEEVASPGPEQDWLAGLALVGKDTWVPDGGRVL